jgi:uncharacterized protein
MLISLARLSDEGLCFEHQYQIDELDLAGHDFSLQQPPRVSGRLDRTGLGVHLRGELEGAVEVPCDRCLREVVIPVHRNLDLFYTPDDPLAGRSGETELQPRDLDFAIYEHEAIDLDELVREQMALSLPTRVLCREDCRGLCSQCGADLNIETCQCQPPMDPRWQALADLKDES